MRWGVGSGCVRRGGLRLAAVLVLLWTHPSTASADEPILLYGPDARAPDSTTAAVQGASLPPGARLRVMTGRAFVLIARGQILQFGPGTHAEFDAGEVRLDRGVLTLHVDSPDDSLRVRLAARDGEIRNASGAVRAFINGQARRLLGGDVFRGERFVATGGRWLKASRADGRYLLDLVRAGAIPSDSFVLRLPSERPGLVRQSVQGYAGIATHRGTRYYLAEITYRLRVWHLRLAYDLWFALSRSGRFYSEAWDQWKDLVDHIDHLQLFMPGDPAFVRLGHIDRLTFGRGLLVDSYTNAVFLPFERRSGLFADARVARLRLQWMVNDVGRPRVFGGAVTWMGAPDLNVTFSVAGDLNQYSNIDDKDGDSYPDRVDPAPDVANSPLDSIIKATNPVSLDSLPKEKLYGAAVAFDHGAYKTQRAEVRVGGEMAVLSSIGTGVSFPAVRLRYRELEVGVGLDLQSPRFSASMFDRTYELDKARFVARPDSSLALVTRGGDLARTEGWLYGWSNSFSLQIRGDLAVRTRFRNIARDEYRNKLFAVAVDASFPFMGPVSRVTAFIEQKNVSQLLRERTDGEIWGFEVRLVPHVSAQVKARYRERYSDGNQNAIIEDSEVDRSFSASMTVDGSYWWDRFREWRARRKEASRCRGAPGAQ